MHRDYHSPTDGGPNVTRTISFADGVAYNLSITRVLRIRKTRAGVEPQEMYIAESELGDLERLIRRFREENGESRS